MPLYEILRLIWWAVLGVLLIGIAVMDGFDLGTAILLPVIGRTDLDRRVMINTVGPVWEGNQVWLILGAGAIFAAWPALYAVAFSGFYLAMLLLLFSLILRPVGFKFRGKLDDRRWRQFWDYALFVSGLVPALVYGVAFGNVLQGVPFHFDNDLRLVYEGSLFGLFNPFALLCGLVSVAMLTMHGGLWLACKTESFLRLRAQRAALYAGLALIVLFVLGGVWAHGIEGYVLGKFGGTDGPSNPLNKEVARAGGQLLANYQLYPWARLAPILGVAGSAVAIVLAWRRWLRVLAFCASGLAIAGVIATAGISLFPFLLPSSSAPQASLTVWDASSSQLTLAVMAVVTALLLPIVMLYTAWVYRVLRGPVRSEDVHNEAGYFY